MSRPISVTTDYIVSDAQIAGLLELHPHHFIVSIVRMEGHVYGSGGRPLGTLPFKGWRVTVVEQ